MTTPSVLTHSPLDGPGARPQAPLAQLGYSGPGRWIPSRYNARTVHDDGRLLVWNTLTGAAMEFMPEHRDGAVAALTAKALRDPLDPYAKHLAARGLLVREGLDEMAIFRMIFGQQHWRSDKLHLILMASEDCNFRCVYCYEKFKHGTMDPEVRQGVRALIGQRAPVLKELSIQWFGGEPLYGWEAIEDLAPFMKSTCEQRGIRFAHAMTTNAYLLTEERATRLLEWGCNSYQITVDGQAAEHDCKRVARDGSPTHAVILDNLRAMAARDAQFKVSLRVNFDQENFASLGAFMEALSEDFGGDPRFRMRFRAIGRWGGPNDGDIETCGLEEKRFVKDQLRSKARDLGLHPEGGIDDVRHPGSQVCYAARPYSYIVGATGKLMKCTIALDEMPENVVGRLSPEGVLEVDPQNFSRWVAPHFETDSLCQTCYVLPGCQGGACPLTRIQSGTRTCCGTKSNLKREMRFSLEEMQLAREGRGSRTATAGAAHDELTP
jgi:uncharacterized protein